MTQITPITHIPQIPQIPQIAQDPQPPVSEIPTVTEREHSAREEIDRLREEIHSLVSSSNEASPAAISEALPAVARLQVVTANLDACQIPDPRAGRALVAVADRRLQKFQDAIERGMAYTGDATMRRLHGEE
jgi:hypothetical protein